jgi:uncharacterized protein (UPF0333 family)
MVTFLAIVLIISIVLIIYLLKKNEELKKALTDCQNAMRRGRREAP